MKHLQLFETFTSKVVIGLDIDGTINNFFDAYNILYKRYFPDKDITNDTDWFWYKKFDYNGADSRKWFNEKKAETFEISQPFVGSVETVNNLYDFIKNQGFTLNIVTNQPTNSAKEAARLWVEKYGFKYDELIFAETSRDKWKYADIMIDDAEKVISVKPLSKVSIKIEQPHNIGVEGDFNIPNIKSLDISLLKKAIDKLKNTNVQ